MFQFNMKAKFLPAYLLTFVNALGFSILIPVLPFIVEQYGAPEYIYGLLLSAYSIFQFIGSPYFGKLSDSIGRKRVLIMTQLGTLASWVIFGVAYFIDVSPAYAFIPLAIIGISRIVDGITGGNVSVTNAYISDISTDKEKSTIFGNLGGIVGLAVVIGPGIGGFSSSGSIGYLGTVLVAIVISLITLATMFYGLKESLVKKRRRKRERYSVIDSIFVLRNIRKLNPSLLVKVVLAVRFIFSVSMAFYVTSVVLFTIDRFDLTERTLGLFMIVVGGFLMFNQVYVYKKVVQKIGELNTLLAGLSFMSIGFILITLTHNFYLYFPLYFVLNLGISLSVPVFNSLLSKYAAQNIQGEIMGISESIRALNNAIWPTISAALFQYFGYVIFYGMSLLPLSGVILLLFVFKKYRT